MCVCVCKILLVKKIHNFRDLQNIHCLWDEYFIQKINVVTVASTDLNI